MLIVRSIIVKKQICELLDISDVSYYRWKQDRLIISFLEKYFTEAEITEYIQTKKIKKLELIKNYSMSELNRMIISSNKDIDDNEIHYRNILFKINTLNIREKAILYHSVNTNNATTKNELLSVIKELELIKKVIEQILNGILFKKKEHDLDMRSGYSFDRDNLYNFILNFTSDIEIKLFLEKPYFK